MIFPWFDHLAPIFTRASGRTHHALLLHGPGGMGKSQLGAALAQAWLCESPDVQGRACDRCPACQWVRNENHPDLHLLCPETGDEEPSAGKAPRARRGKPSSEIRIDQIRALEPFVSMSAHQSGCKVIVVDPADALNIPAANALLKTLEEPTGRTRFVLVTDRPERLPATIRSRCLSVSLSPPPADLALDWLVDVTAGDRNEAAQWLAAAGGAPLRARELADPATASAHRVLVETFAGLPDTALTAAADRLASIEAAVWSAVLLSWIVDLQRCLVGAGPRFFPAQATALQAQARRTTLQSLSRLAREIAVARHHADRSLNPRLMIEDALIRLCSALEGPRQH